MDYMYAACSTTARRGALDWAPKFEAANRPVFEALYASGKFEFQVFFERFVEAQS